MENIKIHKEFNDHSIEIQCIPEAESKTDIVVGDAFMKSALEAFARSARICLFIRCRGSVPSAPTFMEEMGMVFAEAIRTRISESGEYRGIGNAIVGEGDSAVKCDLELPGRQDWFFQITIINKRDDIFHVSDFFSSLARNAKLRLSFKTGDLGRTAAERLFKAFGEALSLSLLSVNIQ